MSRPPTPLELKLLQKTLDDAARKVVVSQKDKERALDQLLRIRVMIARTTAK
jgi:hypothetical protein